MSSRRASAAIAGRSRMVAASVIAGVILAGLTSGASGAAAANEQAIGIAPTAGSSGLSSGGNYFSPTVAAGGTFSSSILLANPNSDAVKVNIYGVDGVTSEGSGSAYTNEDQKVTAAGTWVHVSSTTLTLGSLSRTTLDFSVSIPADASPGDHLAGIAVEGVAPTSTSGSGAVRIKILTRSVIGILVRVKGDASYAMKIGSPTLAVGTYGIGVVNSLITNTGGLLVRPFIVDTLRGPNGYDKSYTRALDTILPGDSTTYKLFWPTALHGTYSITSCVYGGGLNAKICSSGTGTLASATQTQSHNGGAFAPKKPSSGFPIAVLLAIVAVGVLLLVGGGVFFGLRIAKRRMVAQLASGGGQAATPGATGVAEPGASDGSSTDPH